VSKFCGICQRQYYYEKHLLKARAPENPIPQRDGDQDVEMIDAIDREQPAKVGASRGNPQTTPSSGQEQKVSLARIILSACDTCIYCGGKYIG
jgi:hypothetical protein